MAKSTKQKNSYSPSTTTTDTNTSHHHNNNNNNKNGVRKAKKRTRKSAPRESPQQRSSIYRGVTRRNDMWLFHCSGQVDMKLICGIRIAGMSPKTRKEDKPSTYENELKDMEAQSKEEYIGSLRRKSSGFSRGVSKYRGVARHHHNGRWEARIGRVFGNKYLYLGTYATQEEAATAYDMAAIEYRGPNAVTNFDLSHYVKWLKPLQNNPGTLKPITSVDIADDTIQNPSELEIGLDLLDCPEENLNSAETASSLPRPSSALGLLLQSSKFKEMLEQTAATCNRTSNPLEADPPRSSFPEDIQTSFDFQDSNSYVEEHDVVFGNYDSFASMLLQCGLDA
ncbi:hypothetical protein BUALT_Bualt02G0101200 [Buddleja alternifolia]|uniref:AP2/ERF domain-containing protein n=1 Tax=Buddleja alternifolia TaxID=168488 RepID=A0AAV6Y7M0_9LAMI|nr:hypothetical protein BUALT_Bualt02G0101200 [Buddleja alternifolia]